MVVPMWARNLGRRDDRTLTPPSTPVPEYDEHCTSYTAVTVHNLTFNSQKRTKTFSCTCTIIKQSRFLSSPKYSLPQATVTFSRYQLLTSGHVDVLQHSALLALMSVSSCPWRSCLTDYLEATSLTMWTLWYPPAGDDKPCRNNRRKQSCLWQKGLEAWSLGPLFRPIGVKHIGLCLGQGCMEQQCCGELDEWTLWLSSFPSLVEYRVKSNLCFDCTSQSWICCTRLRCCLIFTRLFFCTSLRVHVPRTKWRLPMYPENPVWTMANTS